VSWWLSFFVLSLSKAEMLSTADSEVSTAGTTDSLHSDAGIWDSLYKASYNNLGLTAVPNELALKGGRKSLVLSIVGLIFGFLSLVLSLIYFVSLKSLVLSFGLVFDLVLLKYPWSCPWSSL
jgi:hypothetical protein